MSKVEDLNQVIDEDGMELIPASAIDEQFCRAFVATLSPAKAAIAVGADERGANTLGVMKLREPAIASRVAELFEIQAKELDVQANQLVFELKSIAHSDIGAMIGKDGSIKDVTRLRKHVRKAIKSYQIDEFLDQKTGRVTKRRIKIVLWDKLKALQDLGRTIDLFNERDVTKLLPPPPKVERDTLAVATRIEALLEKGEKLRGEAEEKDNVEDLV